MANPFRNLLMMAALCWVAPASAQQRTLDSAHPQAPGCPGAQKPQVMLIASDGGLGEVPISAGRRAFLP